MLGAAALTPAQLKAISLSKNVVNSINAQKELPAFELFHAPDRVTFKYYVGVLSFLQEDYARVRYHARSTFHELTINRQTLT